MRTRPDPTPGYAKFELEDCWPRIAQHPAEKLDSATSLAVAPPHPTIFLFLHMMSKVSPAVDDISSSDEIIPLPNELMVKILEEVPMPQLLRVRLVSPKMLRSVEYQLIRSNNSV